MSVRRLDSDQPESFAFNADNLAWAQKQMGNYPAGKQASAVIAILWRAQEQNGGWVSRPAMEYVADMLGMSFIRVYEIATFYTMFQLSPVGRTAHIQVCGTTPCMLRGAEDLKKVCQHKIHHDPHHLSADGNFSWEEVECLGACVNAPMIQIWKDTYEDLTPESLSNIIDDLAAGRPAKPGPQNGRQLSAPEGGPTTLLDKDLYSGKRTFTRVEPTPPPAPPAAAAPPPVASPVAAAPSPVAAPSAQSATAAAPPSNASKPSTSAIETAPAVHSPSPVKTDEAVKEGAKIEERAAERVQPVKAPEQVAAARKAGAADVKPAEAPAESVAAKPQARAVETKAPMAPPAAASPEWVAVPRAVSSKPAPAEVKSERPSKLSETAPAARKTAAKSVGKPELLKKPRAGKGDDLKLIWGVGPKLEAMLNSMGVWHFDQIASWSKADLAWVDERLEGFKGRAARDEWVKQAKKLAKGWRPDSAIGEKPRK